MSSGDFVELFDAEEEEFSTIGGGGGRSLILVSPSSIFVDEDDFFLPGELELNSDRDNEEEVLADENSSLNDDMSYKTKQNPLSKAETIMLSRLGYLIHKKLADERTEAELFFLNITLENFINAHKHFNNFCNQYRQKRMYSLNPLQALVNNYFDEIESQKSLPKGRRLVKRTARKKQSQYYSRTIFSKYAGLLFMYSTNG